MALAPPKVLAAGSSSWRQLVRTISSSAGLMSGLRKAEGLEENDEHAVPVSPERCKKHVFNWL